MCWWGEGGGKPRLLWSYLAWNPTQYRGLGVLPRKFLEVRSSGCFWCHLIGIFRHLSLFHCVFLYHSYKCENVYVKKIVYNVCMCNVSRLLCKQRNSFLFQVTSHGRRSQSLTRAVHGARQGIVLVEAVAVAVGGERGQRRGNLLMRLHLAVPLQVEVAQVKKMKKVLTSFMWVVFCIHMVTQPLFFVSLCWFERQYTIFGRWFSQKDLHVCVYVYTFADASLCVPFLQTKDQYHLLFLDHRKVLCVVFFL